MHLAAAAGLAPHAAHGQDASGLAADHTRQRQLTQVERTGQVHVQHMLPLFRGDVGEQLLLGDARIAHQHIHTAQCLFCGAERKLAAGAGCHIALHGGDAGQLFFQLCSGFGIAVVQHRHAVARRIERPGRSGTNAAVAAGDQHTAAIGCCLHGRCRCFLRLFLHRLRHFRLRRRLGLFQHHHPGGFVHHGCCRLWLWRYGRLLCSLFRLRLLTRQIERQFKFIFVQEYSPPVVISALQRYAVQEMSVRPIAVRSASISYPVKVRCSARQTAA